VGGHARFGLIAVAVDRHEVRPAMAEREARRAEVPGVGAPEILRSGRLAFRHADDVVIAGDVEDRDLKGGGRLRNDGERRIGALPRGVAVVAQHRDKPHPLQGIHFGCEVRIACARPAVLVAERGEGERLVGGHPLHSEIHALRVRHLGEPHPPARAARPEPVRPGGIHALGLAEREHLIRADLNRIASVPARGDERHAVGDGHAGQAFLARIAHAVAVGIEKHRAADRGGDRARRHRPRGRHRGHPAPNHKHAHRYIPPERTKERSSHVFRTSVIIIHGNGVRPHIVSFPI
jgi:hypothetical protein